MIDIVMVTWNRPEMTEMSIKTLAKHTQTPCRLIVVDNGSKSDMRTMLIELRDNGIINDLVLLSENIGLEPAKNVGLQRVETELFVSTDNDILAEPPDGDDDWLSKLSDIMSMYPEYASVACRTQIMVGTGDIFANDEDMDVIPFSHPGGSLRIMRTKMVRDVGGWRDDMNSRGQEEMYIAGKLREIGMESGFAVKTKCFHMFGHDGNWGYGDGAPEEHGHKPTAHPAIQQGDDPEEKGKYL